MEELSKKKTISFKDKIISKINDFPKKKASQIKEEFNDRAKLGYQSLIVASTPRNGEVIKLLEQENLKVTDLGEYLKIEINDIKNTRTS